MAVPAFRRNKVKIRESGLWAQPAPAGHAHRQERRPPGRQDVAPKDKDSTIRIAERSRQEQQSTEGRESMLRRIFLLFSFGLLLCGATQAQDLNAYEKRRYVDSQGNSLPYRILFPERYDHGKRYPLVLFLHGAGERGKDNELQLTHGASLFLKDENRKGFPAFVVFPQCPQDAWWAAVDLDVNHTPIALDFDYSRKITAVLKSAVELTQMLIKKERVDSKRIYIVGLSMGGMGTFEAVFRYPGLFAAAIPICGGGDSKAYDKRVAKIPFWIFHGAQDDVVDVKYSREMYARLRELKAEVKYTEYPGIQHESWPYAFAEPQFLPWLFSKKR